VAYLTAKNAPTTKPGTDMSSVDRSPIDRARRIASAPEANEAIMSIRTIDFVAANSLTLAGAAYKSFSVLKK
jgi:hypothetical protein